VLPKWILYCIASNDFKIYVEENQSGSAYPAISDTKVKDFIIPIPCPDNPDRSLAIQAEIVRILDTFTELTAELTAELGDRQKQYNYYRDRLFLGLGDNEKKLGDIADIYLGLTYTPTYVDSGVKFISAQNTSKDFLDLSNVKYISEDEYRKSTSNAKPKRGDVLFTRVGSNLGHPVIVDTDEPLCMFVSLGFIRVNPHKVLNSYIKHWMNTDLFWDQVRRNAYGAAKINLNTGWLNKFDVLLPSLYEQARIVAILDKFDTLATSISQGLPREIALRQQQYEYYRDLLLSFPKTKEEQQ
jgi:type I restriction enzyme, S subunit